MQKKYNRLTLIEEIRSKSKIRQFKCLCDCGNYKIVNLCHLKSGHTKSCGCLHKEKITKHGYYKHPLYAIWQGIKLRCYNSNTENFKYYGKKNIKLCDEWKNNPENFIQWALDKGWKKGLVIDRINSEKNYSPSNCQIISQKENIRKKKNIKLSLKKAKEIRLLYSTIDCTQSYLGFLYNVHKATINDIINNKIWID